MDNKRYQEFLANMSGELDQEDLDFVNGLSTQESPAEASDTIDLSKVSMEGAIDAIKAAPSKLNDALLDFGEYKANVEDDLVEAVKDWGKGAVSGAKEMYRAGQAQAELVPDTTNDYEPFKGDPVYTPEQQKVVDWTNKAGSDFVHETIKPVAMAAATVNAPLAGAMYLPFMVEDFLDVAKKDGAGAAVKEFAKGTVGLDGVDLYNSEGFDTYMKEHPGRALAQLVGSVLAPIQTVGMPMYKAGKRFRDKDITKTKGAIDEATGVNNTPKVEVETVKTPTESELNPHKKTKYKRKDKSQAVKDGLIGDYEQAEGTANTTEADFTVDKDGNTVAKDTSSDVKTPIDNSEKINDINGEIRKATEDKMKAFMDEDDAAIKVSDDHIKELEKKREELKAEHTAPTDKDMNTEYMVDTDKVNRDARKKAANEEIKRIYEETVDKEKIEDAPQDFLVGVKGSGKDIDVSESTLSHTVRRQDVMDAINDFTPARAGRMRAKKDGVLGYFETKSEGIRSKEHGEFGVYAHEIGHYLDKQLKLKGFDQELVDNARAVWGNGQYSEKKLRGEGIAEFTRQYLLNPEEARKNFPTYSAAFEAALGGRQDLGGKVNNLSNIMRKWYTQSAEARARGTIPYEADFPKDSLIDSVKALSKTAYTEIVDKFSPLDNIVKQAELRMGHKLMSDENPYVRAQAVSNVTAARIGILLKGNKDDLNALRTHYAGDGGSRNILPNDVVFKDITSSLDDAVLNKLYPDYLKNGGFHNWYEVLGTYLTSSRILEVHRTKVAEHTAKLKAAIKLKGEEFTQAIQNGDIEGGTAIHTELAKLNRDLKNVDKSYVTPIEVVDAQKTTHDMPVDVIHAATIWDDFNENFLSMAEHFELIKKGTAKNLRAESPNYSPLRRDFYEEQGKISTEGTGKSSDFINLQALYKALDDEGSSRNVSDPIATMETMVHAMISKGERNVVGRLVTNIAKKEGMAELAMKVSGESASNKDMIFYVWENGKKQAYQAICPELVAALKGDPNIGRNIIETGTTMASSVLRYTATGTPPFWFVNSLKDTFTAAVLNPNKKVFIPVFDTLKGMAILFGDKETVSKFKVAGVQHTTLISDNRKIAREHIRRTGVDNWKDHPISSVLLKALDVSNDISQVFEESTRIAIFKQAMKEGKSLTEAGSRASDTTINFSRSGATGQRVNRSVTFFNVGVQGLDKVQRAFREQPLKMSIQAAFWITAPSMALWSINHEKDWYKNATADEKNRFWLVEAGDKIIRFPKPEGVGYLFGSLPERLADYAIDKSVEPLGTATTMLNTLRPSLGLTAVVPLLEVAFNHDLFTSRPINDRTDMATDAPNRFNVYTSEFAKAVGKAIGVSPKDIDHIGKGYLSNYYDGFTGISDLLIGKTNEKPAKKWNEQIFVNRFIHDPEKHSQVVDDFYKGLTEMQQKNNGLKKDGRREASNLKGMEEVNNSLTKLNKASKEIRERKDLTGERKRELMDAYNKQATELCRKAVVHYLGKKYYQKK